jgi:hypothetical protein
MNGILFIILLSCIVSLLHAQDVEIDVAQKVATNWYYSKAQSTPLKSATIIKTQHSNNITNPKELQSIGS